MDTKLFEVRDRQTFIPVIAIRLGSDFEPERYLASRVGFGRDWDSQSVYVLLAKLVGQEMRSDPNAWNCPTMTLAHVWITENWRCLTPGQVIDCEYLRGERLSPALSEAHS